MLPANAISTQPVVSAYFDPDSSDTQDIQSLEEGGAALNDASQGRLVKIWRAYIDGSSIKLEPLLAATPTTTLVSGAGALTSVSLAFDSNMQPVICYVEAGQLKLYWYNSLTSAFQTDIYASATSGRVATDDKRKSQEGASDVIFAYVRANVLYYRQQRDRYLTEYMVGAAVNRKITRLGLGVNYRLHFELSAA